MADDPVSGKKDERGFVDALKGAVLRWLRNDPEYRATVWDIVREEAQKEERAGGPNSPFRRS